MALETPAAARMSDEILETGRDLMMRGDKLREPHGRKPAVDDEVR
jgi:hypothetical protein